jgi:hypothetical protein
MRDFELQETQCQAWEGLVTNETLDNIKTMAAERWWASGANSFFLDFEKKKRN